MQSQDKDKVAYYAALAIFCGSLELFIPRILPFFRLGIANIPIILSLSMPFKSFLLLLFLKGIGNSYISGNLFSIFALVSILQSLSSGIAMYLCRKIFKSLISNYGISMLGAIISTFTQIFLASLYIGSAITSILPLMLLLSLISSIFVAFLSYKLELPEIVPKLNGGKQYNKSSLIAILTLILSGLAAMMTKTIAFTFLAFLFALGFQHISGRKIKLLPHIMIIAFMVFSSLLAPMGKVLFSIGPITITENALIVGVEKALRLSSGIAISQGYSRIIKPGNGIVGKTLGYFTALIASFRETGGSLINRAKETLELKTLNEKHTERKEISPIILIVFSLIFIIFALVSRIYP